MVTPIRPRPGGSVAPANEFDMQIKQKLVGDNTVTRPEADQLTQAWGSRQLTPEQANQLKAAVQGNSSTFDRGAARVMDRFVNLTLPTITIRQGLGGVPPNSAKLSWDIPTKNVDGSPLTNIKGYQIFYGTSPGNYTKSVDVNDPSATTKQIDNLTSGTWYFAIRTAATNGEVSAMSGEVSKTIP
jgi:hypothetical protein